MADSLAELRPPINMIEACCPSGTVPLRFRYLSRGMPLAREQRKLAAIVAADVVGYSRLMGRDESGTLARLRGTALNASIQFWRNMEDGWSS